MERFNQNDIEAKKALKGLMSNFFYQNGGLKLEKFAQYNLHQNGDLKYFFPKMLEELKGFDFLV